MGAITTTNSQTSQPMDEGQISAFSDAKRRLAARLVKLKNLLARAKKGGITKTVLAIEADIKEANSLTARAAAADAMLAPLLKAWAWAKSAMGLGDLGAFPLLVPIAVAASISGIIYAINVLDRKLETTADRYEAEINAVEAWKGQGLDADAARDQVNKTGEQITKIETNKPGLFGNLGGLVKFGAAVAAIGGGLWWMNEKSKQRVRK